jgi:hypothetical protein
MAKVIALTVGGTKLTSGLDASIQDTGVRVHHVRNGTLRDTHVEHFLSFAGANVTRFDEGRSIGSAAVGAVVGGVLTGGLGALAGAALGGRKRHSVVLRHADAQLVFEASTAELQRMVASGVELDATVAGEPSVTQREWKSLTLLAIMLMLVLGVFVLAAVLTRAHA